MNTIDWTKQNILYIANEIPEGSDTPDEKQLRSVIEPWLTAVFQSEHLSLLLGTGLTAGICVDAGIIPQAMQRIEFSTYKDIIRNHSENEAANLSRGKANFEDDLRLQLNYLKD